MHTWQVNKIGKYSQTNRQTTTANIEPLSLQRKSREESQGAGSGVEILTNQPYTEGPGGSGQYTYKIYHIGSHLPGEWYTKLKKKHPIQVSYLLATNIN